MFQNPWSVAIVLPKGNGNDGTKLHCSGSLLTQTFILTAAHCFHDENGPVSQKNMDLIVGANQPTNQTALDIDKMKNRPLSQSKKIKEVMLHPSFDKSTVSPMYDLALVEIQGSFTFDKRSVWPICVPDDVRPREDHFYNGYHLVGFGTDTSDSRNCRECLKTDQLNVKTTAFCNDRYKNNQDINFDDEPMICARVTGQSSGSCKGDSGGILWTPVFSSDTGELAVQQAVVRGSVRNCDGSRFPSIFNRLDSQEVLPWIKANVFGKFH